MRLRVVEQRPYEEVAQELGISDGRSPGRLHLYGGELRATAQPARGRVVTKVAPVAPS